MWLNALVESAGGHIIEKNATDPNDDRAGPDSEAGTRAREVMRGRDVRRRWPRPSRPRTRTPTPPSSRAGRRRSWSTGRSSGRGPTTGRGGHAGPVGARGLRRGALPPGRRRHAEPHRRSAGSTSASGAFSQHTDLAYEAAQCITSDENQAYYFVTNGNPAAPSRSTTTPTSEGLPQAPVIRESLELAAPRPQSAVLQRGHRRSSASTTRPRRSTPTPASGRRPHRRRTRRRRLL